jgi:hypothetical protein
MFWKRKTMPKAPPEPPRLRWKRRDVAKLETSGGLYDLHVSIRTREDGFWLSVYRTLEGSYMSNSYGGVWSREELSDLARMIDEALRLPTTRK